MQCEVIKTKNTKWKQQNVDSIPMLKLPRKITKNEQLIFQENSTECITFLWKSLSLSLSLLQSV